MFCNPVGFVLQRKWRPFLGRDPILFIRQADSGITGSFPGGTRESVRDWPLSGSICGRFGATSGAPLRLHLAYSHMTTGLCAGFLKLLTGTRVIIEIVTSPNLVYLTERPHPTWKERLMHLYSDACLHLSMLLADRAHFLFPQQLSMYPMLRKVKNSVFHEFVPVSMIDKPQEEASEKYVLLVGHRGI